MNVVELFETPRNGQAGVQRATNGGVVGTAPRPRVVDSPYTRTACVSSVGAHGAKQIQRTPQGTPNNSARIARRTPNDTKHTAVRLGVSAPVSHNLHQNQSQGRVRRAGSKQAPCISTTTTPQAPFAVGCAQAATSL